MRIISAALFCFASCVKLGHRPPAASRGDAFFAAEKFE
jgi:hypothetical protein